MEEFYVREVASVNGTVCQSIRRSPFSILYESVLVHPNDQAALDTIWEDCENFIIDNFGREHLTDE